MTPRITAPNMISLPSLNRQSSLRIRAGKKYNQIELQQGKNNIPPQ
jgi:hypothetical protein